MEVGQKEIQEVVRSIWESVLGWDAEPAPTPEIPRVSGGYLTAFIQIAGTWEGAVVCISSTDLVRRAAGAMFGMQTDELTTELLFDALGELTNMVGGNLKALMPGPSYLCLPAVIEGSDYSVRVPSAMPMADASFVCQGELFTVKILALGRRRQGKEDKPHIVSTVADE